MDLYRLSGTAKDLEALDIPRVFQECICLIEWPDRLLRQQGDNLLPEAYLEINFINAHDNADTRIVTIIPHGKLWEDRLGFLKEEGYLDDLLI